MLSPPAHCLLQVTAFPSGVSVAASLDSAFQPHAALRVYSSLCLPSPQLRLPSSTLPVNSCMYIFFSSPMPGRPRTPLKSSKLPVSDPSFKGSVQAHNPPVHLVFIFLVLSDQLSAVSPCWRLMGGEGGGKQKLFSPWGSEPLLPSGAQSLLPLTQDNPTPKSLLSRS